MTKEQVKLLMEEGMQKLALEREEMKLQLQKQREMDMAVLAAEREKHSKQLEITQKEMERQMAEELQKMKSGYERELSAVLKGQEEMKHYWEMKRQQENKQNTRQFISNQVTSVDILQNNLKCFP